MQDKLYTTSARVQCSYRSPGMIMYDNAHVAGWGVFE
jgi:aerobic-type carbon monoxide dehydrogenase small subunit (CoxS/CutS family)